MLITQKFNEEVIKQQQRSLFTSLSEYAKKNKEQVKICKECHTLFVTLKKFNGDYCVVCYSKIAKKKRVVDLSERTCKYCGKIFKPNNSYQKYCDKKCSQNYFFHYRTTFGKKVCPICDKEFNLKSRKQIYCNKRCNYIARLGRLDKKIKNNKK